MNEHLPVQAACELSVREIKFDLKKSAAQDYPPEIVSWGIAQIVFNYNVAFLSDTAASSKCAVSNLRLFPFSFSPFFSFVSFFFIFS